MRTTVALALSAFVTTAIAGQIQSDNPAFPAGSEGCIAASANATGAAVIIQQCFGSGDRSRQFWNFAQNASPQPLNILGDKCLDVTNGVNADGTKLQIWTCVPGSTNQQWIPLSDGTFQWSGTNKCVDLTNGNTTTGNQLQIWTCDASNSNQHWSSFPHPPTNVPTQFRASGNLALPSVCLTASSSTDGSGITLDVCGSPAAGQSDTWIVPLVGSSGTISTFNSTKCLDVRDGNPANGNLVQVWDCVPGSTNQMFHLDGPIGARSISWVGQNKCLDIKDGVFAPGNATIQIWDCDPNNTNQHWFLQ